MAIDIRGLGNQAALAQIAKLAYGSGSSEKMSGGKGNIGILNGRVVKFNTHWSERGGAASAEMRASCDALRLKLSEIATAMLAAAPDASPKAREGLEKALRQVRRALGLNADGAQVATDALLDRTVVAKVVNVLRKATGFDAWQGLGADSAKPLSSKGVDTTFGAVRAGVRFVDDVQATVRDAVAAIVHPANGKAGVALSEKATKFLTDLILRDLEAQRAAGAEAQSLEEIDRAIRDFSSPYLVTTLAAFNLLSSGLAHAYLSVGSAEPMVAPVVGSPRNQLADRADVALAFIRNDADSSYGAFAMALVAEKMPEMRRLQPHGRLTGATVWKACFGESVPKAAGSLGSPEFVKAFFKRLDDLTKKMAAKHGVADKKDATLATLIATDPMVSTGLFNGEGFTPILRKAIRDPKFVPDVTRDYVASMPLYAVPDAVAKTEKDLEHQLMIDFRRNFPLITATCGDVEETADFRPFKGQHLSDEQHLEHVRGFVAQMDRVFGDAITPAQRSVMLIGFTQAGFTPFTALVGVGGEHVQGQVSVRREDDGSLLMTYATLPNCPIEAQYGFRIEPDGTNYCVGDFVRRMRPQPAAQ